MYWIGKEEGGSTRKRISPPLPKIMLCAGPTKGSALPSHHQKCKWWQPDSRTAFLITVTTQPGMLRRTHAGGKPWNMDSHYRQWYIVVNHKLFTDNKHSCPWSTTWLWFRLVNSILECTMYLYWSKEKKESPQRGPEINPSSAEQTLGWGNWVVFN